MLGLRPLQAEIPGCPPRNATLSVVAPMRPSPCPALRSPLLLAPAFVPAALLAFVSFNVGQAWQHDRHGNP